LSNHFGEHFIKDWSPTIDYRKYFSDCSPLLCTYITTDHTNFAYTIVLLLSLYGGLTVMLRSITSFLIDIVLKLKFCSRTDIIDPGNVQLTSILFILDMISVLMYSTTLYGMDS
jgi:hypothetical protein